VIHADIGRRDSTAVQATRCLSSRLTTCTGTVEPTTTTFARSQMLQGSEGYQRWHRLTTRVNPTALPNRSARTYPAAGFYHAGVVRVTEIVDAGNNMLQRLRAPGRYHTRPRDMGCGGAFSASTGHSYRTWLARTQEIQTRIPVAATQLGAFDQV
jgi:hypothetical protein